MSDHVPKPLQGCVDVALEVPMRQLFSYLYQGIDLKPGMRVSVPFGNRNMVGVVVANRAQPPENIKLREIHSRLDNNALFSSHLLRLTTWTAAYYHQSVGEVWRTAMPAVLRKGRAHTHGLLEWVYGLDLLPEDWRAQLGRAPLQRRVIEAFDAPDVKLTHAGLQKSIPGCTPAIKALLTKKYLQREKKMTPVVFLPGSDLPNTLTPGQADAYQKLSQNRQGFQCQVLQGITGSGKTEVYFAMIDHCLKQQQQTLVLVPEIALTDQLFARFKRRFGSRVVQIHSGMSDANRYRRWWEIRSGSVEVVLATRSGVFLEFKQLGLIVVDEEHDLSYKQQEGVRYHARSVAIKRAQIHDIPVILGSATPSLETVQNIKCGRYQQVQLLQRVGNSTLPEIQLLDLNQARVESGLSPDAIQAIGQTLERKQQALIFINRRGYAPVLFCPSCQWTAQCKRCDAQMTLHQISHALQCHHCGARRGVPQSCDACGAQELINLGEGTQRVEESLRAHFPQASIQRFDRDELNTAQKLKTAMDKVHAREVDILVGTQLLSKGHDFSKVSLVVVINADQGLHSIDFRAPELLVQQLIQVAGRAGRGSEKGRVLIQTCFPAHPSLLAVKHHQYTEFADRELAQRQRAHFPPYSHMALWRARGRAANEVLQFLNSVARHGRSMQPAETFCYDPVKSPMFKRSGQYHAQLLISSRQRSALHQWLKGWIKHVEQDKLARKIKWSIDVDPVSLF